MHKLALTVSLVSLLAAPLAAAADPAEKPVLAALETWKQALIKKDRAAFEKVLHPDLVYGHSDGHFEDKATCIKMIVDGKAVWEAVDFADTKVTIRGGNTAFVTGKVEYREREDGKLFQIKLAVLSVWVKGPQGWQMIARHATRPTPAVTLGAAPAPAAPAKK
jgi:ketosteroid isomerase-like protein